jgi:catechol 2,3-dioxygenase-like lactoylglutathione lyase family enzyme
VTTPSVECLAFNHINLVLEDFDLAVAHFERVYGAQFVMDLPQPEWHAALLHFGRVLAEIFVSDQYLLQARYGPHFVGLEYQVADLAAAKRAVEARGIRIVRDIGAAFHTHPADCFGVAFEFFEGNFYTDKTINWLEPLKPATYWRDENPLAYVGLDHYSIAVRDLPAASDFLQGLLGAVPSPANASLSGANATVQRLTLADTTVELVSPSGAGSIEDHLNRYGDGIRSMTLKVVSLARAREHLDSVGIQALEDDDRATLIVPAAQNCGLLFELSE